MRSRRLPAGREKFPLSLPTTPRFEICQTSGQKNFPLTHYYTRRRAKWPGSQPGNKKAANLFQDLLLSLSAGGRLVFCLEHGEGRAALLAARPFDYPSAKAGGAVNGGVYAPFILPLTGSAGFAISPINGNCSIFLQTVSVVSPNLLFS